MDRLSKLVSEVEVKTLKDEKNLTRGRGREEEREREKPTLAKKSRLPWAVVR